MFQRVSVPVVVFAAALAAGAGGLFPAPALAQPPPDPRSDAAGAPKQSTVYAGGSLLLTSERRTSATGVDESWATSGAGLGFSGVFGAGRRLGVEVEVTRPPFESGLLEFPISGGTVTQQATLHQTLISAFVRWRRPARRLAIEPVGGFNISLFRGSKLETFTPDPPGTPSAYTSPLVVTGLGLGGGVDVVRPLAPHLALVGSFRLYRVIWRDLEEFYPAVPNIPGWVGQIGGGLRVGWREPGTDRLPSPSHTAEAVAARARGYLGGSAGVFTQPVGEADGHYLSTGLGGTGMALAATVGGFFAPHWSAAAEVSRGPALTAVQWFTYRIRYDTIYHDTLVGGFLRWHPRPAANTTLEPVFGGVVTVGQADRTETDFSWIGSPSPPRDASVTRIRFGAAGGADFLRRVTRHVALVASFRLNVLARRDARNDQPPELGVGRWVFHYSAGARWLF